MGSDAEEALPPVSSLELEQEEEDDDCYLSDQEDALEESVLQVLEDGHLEDCHWSSSSVITKECLLAAQREDLRKVMELLGLKEHNARTLLIHYRWDVERIFELLDQKGRDRLFSEAGVPLRPANNAGLPSATDVTCNVCFEDVPLSAASEMDCGHNYCNECWTEYFIVKINEGQSRRVKCMAPKCNAICDEALVRKLVSAKRPDIAERFERFLLESYIEDNDTVKWCPSTPHCGNAIRVKGDIHCEVECACGRQFCFNCSSEAHSPCSCVMWEHWIKKCRDESETVNWITVNTKPCPKCHKPVEKNGGCNLVACICGQAFCWLCGDATGRDHTWSSISGHSCGRFTQDQSKRTEQARRNLYRYMHYHNRYKAHTDSLKQEAKLKDDIQIFKDEMTPEERELKQNLFEDQQQQLEFNVERLSGFLEKDFQNFTDDEVMDTMKHVINLANVVDRLCKQMYQRIENDLLYPLRTPHNIAPYKSKGLDRASELHICLDSAEQSSQSMNYSQDEHKSQPGFYSNISGSSIQGKRPILQLHGSSSDNSGRPSHKRERTDAHGGGALFDLNVPAEVADKI